MKVKASKGEGKDFVLPKAGNRVAILVAVVDLGMHRSSFEGQDNGMRRKVAFVWEFARKEPAGSPGFIIKEYLFSGDEKAALRQALQAWRGKTYRTDEEMDLAEGLGKGWLINIQHKAGKANPEKIYANIGAVGPLPEGVPEPEASVTPFEFDASGGDPFPDPEWLPKLYGQTLADLIRLGAGGEDGPRSAGSSSDVETPF